MSKMVIDKTIEILAPVQKVWRVFTDPVVTRQMGGEYASDWKAGSSFGWKGLDGKMYTRGKILEVEPEKLIRHQLFDMKEENKLLSVITYHFVENGEQTVLTAKEELNYVMTPQQMQDASDGWDAALKAVKETAENL